MIFDALICMLIDFEIVWIQFLEITDLGLINECTRLCCYFITKRKNIKQRLKTTEGNLSRCEVFSFLQG